MRGKGLFLQRCSLCHLPQGRRLRTSPPLPYGPDFRILGPTLNGLFKAAKPEKESAVRNTILEGGPTMPGFQYGLEPKEMDDLIAYLKTL